MTLRHSDCKLLVFIVAYNAEKTITSVLSRIPVDRLPPHTAVLVIDDRSSDRTFETAMANRDKFGGMDLTVLYNPVNQGYGGNQKLGYQYAIEKGFDVVALVHGDGQYAPELLPELIEPLLSGEADACFGSRMMKRGAAISGGMPLYKYVGNKVLTFFENRALGLGLSEFHSGYRIYSVAALKRLPFTYNTNDFHFDTEIIIQFSLAGLRIKELPIPTYYGDEICYVNGMKYAWNVFRAVLASRVHRMGVFFQRKYSVETGSIYDLKLGYVSSHTLAIDAIPPGASVLDLACGRGYVARELTRRGCRVTGLDRLDAGEILSGAVERYIRHDLEAPALPAGLGHFDCILALDCLEHLADPEGFLAQLRDVCYAEGTRLIATGPNIGFITQRLGLLMGQFNYGRQGILDLTHKRLFTFRSFRRLFEGECYTVSTVKGIPAPFPKAMNGWLGRALLEFNRVLIFCWQSMFSYQIYLEAEMTPPVSRLLQRTLESSRQRRGEPEPIAAKPGGL